MEILITILAVIFILFLPGFFLTFVFFNHKQIDSIERLALSFGLSIAVAPLIVFYANLLGIPIASVSVLLEVCGILLVTALILLIQHVRRIK